MDKRKLTVLSNGLKWENRYRKWAVGEGKETWFTPNLTTLDPDFENSIGGRIAPNSCIMDIGTGLGWQAIRLAEKGFQVTAIDASETAIGVATKNANKIQTSVEFQAADLFTVNFPEPFDCVIDRGCFTVLNEDSQQEYVSRVWEFLAPKGWLLLKLNARMTTDSVTSLFEQKFEVRNIKDSTWQGSDNHAYLARYFELQKI